MTQEAQDMDSPPIVERDVLSCIGCKYDLRKHASDAVCPECGEPVINSIVATRDRTFFSRETRMLRRESSYRRNRNASIVLAGGAMLLLLLVVFVIPLPYADPSEDPSWVAMLLSTLFGAVLWTALAWGFNARFQHCRSIRYYRAANAT